MAKISIEICGQQTSLVLDPAHVDGLHELAKQRGTGIIDIVEEIAATKPENLSSAVRERVLLFYRDEEPINNSPSVRSGLLSGTIASRK